MEWSEELSTGDEEIDSQHKEFIRRVNMLLEACDRGTSRAEVGFLIGFLADYIVTHFTAEEQIMTGIGYSGYAEHKAEHAMFIGQICEIKEKFIKEGSGLHVVLLTIRISVEWLIGHIGKTDKKFGAALKKLSAGREANRNLSFGVAGHRCLNRELSNAD